MTLGTNINTHDDDEPDDPDETIDQSNDSADEICNDVQQPERYPRRDRRPPTKWYVGSTAKSRLDVAITTSDEPTLSEAMKATPEGRDLWIAAIEGQFKSLEEKETWVHDDEPKSQPLPTHVVLKIKRNSDGSAERFKARVVVPGGK